MPVYEYRCLDCHEIFERTEPMSEHASIHPACPRCEGTNVEQVFSQFFAKTDRKS
jgi:putative FmdB family regulatory protein